MPVDRGGRHDNRGHGHRVCMRTTPRSARRVLCIARIQAFRELLLATAEMSQATIR